MQKLVIINNCKKHISLITKINEHKKPSNVIIINMSLLLVLTLFLARYMSTRQYAAKISQANHKPWAIFEVREKMVENATSSKGD